MLVLSGRVRLDAEQAAEKMSEQLQGYVVHAARTGDGWGLTVPDVPSVVGNVRRLREAEDVAREAIARATGASPGSFGVKVDAVVPGPLGEELEHARALASLADAVQCEAAAAARNVAHGLRDTLDLEGAEIAELLGRSPQRVSQLLKQPPTDRAGFQSTGSVLDRMLAYIEDLEDALSVATGDRDDMTVCYLSRAADLGSGDTMARRVARRDRLRATYGKLADRS